MLDDVKNPRKVVLHLNSQYKEAFEEGLISIEQIELIVHLSQIVVIEMDWGTFDLFKFGDQEAIEDEQKDEEKKDEDEEEVDIVGQLTKFAFDSAVGNMKKIGIVMFIESKMVLPKVEKTCKFLNMKIDDTITYANLV